MVHALNLINSVLKPGSTIVTFQSHPSPDVISINSANSEMKIGWLDDSTDFSQERAASRALGEMVAARTLLFSDEVYFDYVIEIDTQEEFDRYLKEDWETAEISETTRREMKRKFDQAAQPVKIDITIPTRMTILTTRPVHSKN